MNLERYRVHLAVVAAISSPLILAIWRYLDPDTPVAIAYQAFAAALALTAVALLATRITVQTIMVTAHFAGILWWLTVVASRLFARDATGSAQDMLTADLYLAHALLIVITYLVLPIGRAAQVVIGMLVVTTLLVASWALRPGTLERDPAALGVGIAFQAILVVIAQMTQVLAKARSERDDAVQHAAKWRSLADHDPLTGLPNRRALELALARQYALAQRHDTPIAVLYIDVDHFKRFNDSHGHAAGDEALAHIGSILRSRLRTSDHYGRWGGEEFLAIAPGEGAGDALSLAERLRHAVATNPGPSHTTLTISIGVATSPPCSTPTELVDTADQRLYEAKRLGRNRVVGPDASHRPNEARSCAAANGQAN